MDHGDVILRFDDVSYEYDHKKKILEDTSFSVRTHAKLTIVGQNGAGKSTIFKLITGELQPKHGKIHCKKGVSIAIAKQVVSQDDLKKTVREFFAGAFKEKKYDLDRLITAVLDIVHCTAPFDKTIESFSGGQKARLLLAFALIQQPDILLLDEPTNNLDADGIAHLTSFLVMYEKTCIVISHDAAFLNSFTHGVLHLDVFTKAVTQYVGDYYDVVEQIEAQIEREQRQNARMEKQILDQKEKINFFSHKGGKMRKLASKMRDAVEDAEENKVQVRREDKTIPPFSIPITPCSKPLAKITSVTIIKDHKPIKKNVQYTITKGDRLRITGPNGIGKTTLLDAMAHSMDGTKIDPEVRVGYYRQDFSGLPLEKTVYQVLEEAMEEQNNQEIYATAARFLLQGETVQSPIYLLSEGQKGLLCFARFLLQEPTLLVLDEPTNHINFRHLPVIADALNDYEGGIIIVSHDQEFVDKIYVTQELDLASL